MLLLWNARSKAMRCEYRQCERARGWCGVRRIRSVDIDFRNEIVVVGNDSAILFIGILSDGGVCSSFPECGNEVDVFGLVTVVLQSMEYLVFDILVQQQPIRYRSLRCVGWRH